MIWKQVLAFLALWTLSAATLLAQSAPSFISSPKTEAKLGEEYQYFAQAIGDPLPEYLLEVGPAGMEIDGKTGTITWAPQAGGEFEVKLIATNDNGTDAQEYVISVYGELTAPVITSNPVIQVQIGQDYSYDVDATGDPAPTYSLADGPDGMTIDKLTGVITWSPTSVGLVAVSAVASNDAGSDIQDFTISVVEAFSPPDITSTPGTKATVGDEYHYEITTTGNPFPALSLDVKPVGMTLDDAQSLITWTPQSAGTYPVTLRASNEAGNDIQEFSIIVAERPVAPQITSNPVTSVVQGQKYVYDVNASGTPSPSFALSTGPQTMTIDPQTGQISWEATAVGQYNVTVTASNEAGSDSQSFVLSVTEPLSAPVITSSPPTQATTNQTYRYEVKAAGNPTPTFSLVESPAGMTMNASGVVRWTPQVTGTFNVQVSAANSEGEDTQSFSITVAAQPVAPSILSSPITSTFVGEPYTYDVDADGTPAPTFALIQAPEDMTIDAASGEISWTPVTSGGFSIIIEATNSQGSDTQEYTLTVQEQLFEPVFISTPSTQAFLNQLYEYTAITDANPGATYALIEAPASMSLNTQTGEISWTPTQVGSFHVLLRASNTQGSVDQDFSITVSRDLAPPTISSTPITQALVGIEYAYDVDAVGNPAPTFSLVEAPTGMDIDDDTGLIAWVPATPGSFKVTIEATNSEGSFTQSFDIIVGILGSAPLVQLQTVRIVSPNTLNLTAFANPNGSPTRVTIEYGVDNVDENQVTTSPEIINGFGEIEVVAQLSGLEEGKTYSYRAIAENSIGRQVSGIRTFTTYQSAIPIGVERPFSGSLDSLSYRLLSIPGNADIDARETLDGSRGKDWSIYTDTGEPANYFKAYDGSEQFHFKPGRGFWILGNSNWVVPDETISTVPLDDQGATQIALQEGWNIIASPFHVSVPWNLVRVSSPAVSPTAKLWGFNGAFGEVSTLEPYQAYYYFNDAGEGASLSIPFPGLYQNAAKRVASKRSANTGAAPTLVLEATGFDSLSASVEIIIDEHAYTDKDRLDQYAPRNGFSSLSLLIDPSFEAPYGFLALDARPAVDEGASYDLVLDATAGKRIELRASGLDGFIGLEIYLADLKTGEFVDLRERALLAVYPESNRTRYRLLIGPAAFVDAQKTALVPKSFLLQQNYPNPFAGSTTITYSLSEAGYVDLSVYDVLGRKVEQLFMGEQSAGFHEMAWDGGALPGGAYLLRMQTESGRSHVVSMTKVR